MFVLFDKKTDDFIVKLPDSLRSYFADLNRDLIDKFGFEPINKDVIIRMNEYINDWFSNRGIDIPKGNSNEPPEDDQSE